MPKRRTSPKHTNTLSVSTMRMGGKLPILIECWGPKGQKAAVRTDGPGARHVAALLLKHATDLERAEAEQEPGVERVRREY